MQKLNKILCTVFPIEHKLSNVIFSSKLRSLNIPNQTLCMVEELNKKTDKFLFT